MKVDNDLITYLEDLSCLSLSETEKENMADDLSKLIERVGRLGKLNLDGVPECSHPLDNINVFRDDVVEPSWDRELILRNAPAHTEEMFIAPKTVE